MKRFLIIIACSLFIVACSDDTPTIIKESTQDDNIKEPVLIKGEDDNTASEETDMLLEFNLPNEQVTLNLNNIGILNSFLDSSDNRDEEISKMKLQKVDILSYDSLYLLEFSCFDTICSYMLLDQQDDGRSYLLEDLTASEAIIPSPNGSKLVFLFSRNQENLDWKKNKIIVFDIKNWKTVSYTSQTEETLSEFIWPISKIDWINNDSLTVNLPDIQDPASEMDEWLDSPMDNKQIQLNFVE